MARLPAQRVNPRLSASQLADYLVAPTPVGQIGILRQAKNPGPSKPLIIQYAHARRTIADCLRDRGAMHRLAAASLAELEARRDNSGNGPLVRDDAQRCMNVIDLFQRSYNQLDLWNAEYLAPRLPSPALNISGVEVSVSPDAIAVDRRRPEPRVGQVFVRCAMGEAGDLAEGRRAEANNYLATIAHMHTVQYVGDLGAPYAPSSLVVDVSRSRVVRGSVNSSRRIANVNAACEMIRAIWPGL